VRTDVVQLVDLFPTVLAACGVQPPSHHGRNILVAEAPRVDALAFAEYYYPRQVLSVFSDDQLARLREDFAPYLLRRRAVQDGRFKLERTSRDAEIWHELRADPAEEIPIEATGAVARRLGEALDGFVAIHQGDPPLPPTPPLGWRMPGFRGSIDDPELLEHLKALGYVE
jgi:arylsulfatase A-like enzyme